jgi:5-methylthioadenosine/S-adenosylhomocysteine deaminase
VIEQGAVLSKDGVVKATGTLDEMKKLAPGATVKSYPNHVMLPGFVNSHHHVGLTPLQLGSPDYALELWFAGRMPARKIDLYLDTLYSAFEMIASGVTTVQHIHGWMAGGYGAIHGAASKVLNAYRDLGMRASYCYAVREQNRLVYEADEEFCEKLPKPLGPELLAYLKSQAMPFADFLTLFDQLTEENRGQRLTRIQLAPANLHWCTDDGLLALNEKSKAANVPMHMHLLETAYQKEYAMRRTGKTAVRHLHDLGLLSPRMTLGHGVWLTEEDIDITADTGTCICHNCSSNFRLRSGVAALNHFEKKGINTAIGLDEAGINDDRDMLQELKLVLRAHRVPGMVEADVPTMSQVLRMATVGGAKTTPYGETIGSLEVGKGADMVLIDWDQVAYPYLDELTPTLDAVVQRAKNQAVTMTMCDGEVIYQDGKFTKVDRTAALKALHDDLAKALADDELERRKLSVALLPYARKFYENYIDTTKHQPFYRPSSMV